VLRLLREHGYPLSHPAPAPTDAHPR